jgi:hypothetical protein
MNTEAERRELLRSYQRSIHVWHTGYDDAASSFSRKGRLFGIVTAMLSAVVATAAFTSLSADGVPTVWKVIAGILSSTAAVAAGMAATLKYPEMAVTYRATANKYGKVRHQAELLDVRASLTDDDLQGLVTAWEQVQDDAPILSDRQYHHAEARVDGKSTSSRFRKRAEVAATMAVEAEAAARSAAEHAEVAAAKAEAAARSEADHAEVAAATAVEA